MSASSPPPETGPPHVASSASQNQIIMTKKDLEDNFGVSYEEYGGPSRRFVNDNDEHGLGSSRTGGILID